jgi:hypothetical protein
MLFSLSRSLELHGSISALALAAPRAGHESIQTRNRPDQQHFCHHFAQFSFERPDPPFGQRLV